MAQFDTGKSLQQTLYTNDGWDKRRKWLRRGMFWESISCTVIMVFAAYTGSENAILQVAFVTLAGAFVAQFGLYVFGVQQDDADKRQYTPPPTPIQMTALTQAEFNDLTPPPEFDAQQKN